MTLDDKSQKSQLNEQSSTYQKYQNIFQLNKDLDEADQRMKALLGFESNIGDAQQSSKNLTSKDLQFRTGSDQALI